MYSFFLEIHHHEESELLIIWEDSDLSYLTLPYTFSEFSLSICWLLNIFWVSKNITRMGRETRFLSFNYFPRTSFLFKSQGLKWSESFPHIFIDNIKMCTSKYKIILPLLSLQNIQVSKNETVYTQKLLLIKTIFLL